MPEPQLNHPHFQPIHNRLVLNLARNLALTRPQLQPNSRPQSQPHSRSHSLKIDHPSLELRHTLRYDPVLKPFMFLIRPYRRSCFYFDMIDMARRILLISILPMLYSLSPSQKAIFGCIISLLWLMVVSTLKPYAKETTNGLAMSLQYIVFFTYFLALTVNLDIYGKDGVDLDEWTWLGGERRT